MTEFTSYSSNDYKTVKNWLVSQYFFYWFEIVHANVQVFKRYKSAGKFIRQKEFSLL